MFKLPLFLERSRSTKTVEKSSIHHLMVKDSYRRRKR
jgi:hypothetical protein